MSPWAQHWVSAPGVMGGVLLCRFQAHACAEAQRARAQGTGAIPAPSPTAHTTSLPH
jgi:hypothetical protein